MNRLAVRHDVGMPIPVRYVHLRWLVTSTMYNPHASDAALMLAYKLHAGQGSAADARALRSTRRRR